MMTTTKVSITTLYGMFMQIDFDSSVIVGLNIFQQR
uniref:Uncharacterized protein n=1 Tax=Octopus bimaculoides TaxID=37653 RepID=A0A0L8GN72_OCTBM